jgi:hypothetical protein
MIGLSAAIALLQAMSEGPDAAAQALERVRASNPERHDGIAATISIWWGPPDEALKELPTVSDQALPGPIRGCFRLVLNRLAVGARMTGLPGTCSELSTDWRIRLLSRTGQVDEAYALFDASNSADRRANMFLFYPEMKAFRQDARFLPLTRRIGLYAYWQETGKWPDFCEEPDLPYDCRAG